MGYTFERHAGGEIRNYEPDDDEDTLYILSDSFWATSLEEIIERARVKWGSATKIEDLYIKAEYIHTRCLGYDRYDPSDYDCYLVITLDE